MFSQARHQFLDTSRENLILWIFYFGIQQLCTYFPVYLTSQPPFACLHPRHLLHLYPFPSLTTSHLLDLIEFFPEEEMFPPNESVEILHSDKHDPIFRLIKESFSLSLSSLLSSHLFVAARAPSFPRSPFFRSMIFDYTLNASLWNMLDILIHVVAASRGSYRFESYGNYAFNFYKLFNLISPNVLFAECISTIKNLQSFIVF